MTERLVLLCGGPDITVAGTKLHLAPPARSQSTLALAFMLFASGRSVTADELADAVWPQGPPKSWPAGLRRIVSDVRAWLATGGVVAEIRAAHGTYELVLRDAADDITVGRAALRRARQANDESEPTDAALAVEMLGKPLLPGYDAPWLTVQRRDLEREFLEALDLLADAERRHGNADAAVAAAERAVAIDPIRESSYRQAMAAHRQAGRIGAALRAYEACRQVLIEQLGTGPSPATVTAYHALLDLPLERPGAVVPVEIEEPELALTAAATAMHRLESRSSIAALEARLATIDASPTPDPLRRVRTLTELGRAYWTVEGSTEALRRVSLAAGEAALSLRDSEAFGDALALASTTTGIGQIDLDAAEMCTRASVVFEADPRVQVRILGLEAELVFGDESIERAQRAVEQARATGDRRLLLDMLLVLDQSLAWTPDVSTRLRIEAECDELLAELPATFRRRPTFEVMTRLELADRSWFEEQRAAYPGTGRQLPWEERVFVGAMRGVEAHVTGEIDEANRIAGELLAEAAGELNTTHAVGGLLLAIARDAGGIGPLLPAIYAISESNPRIAAFRAALALAHVIAGDESSARAIIDEYAASGFDNIAKDHVYLLYLGLLSEAVAMLDAEEYVVPLLALLEPYADLLCVGAHGVVILSAMDTYRGMLASVTGDARGPEWFDAGIATEERLGATLLAARSKAWKARWHRRFGDAATAHALVAEARETATAKPGRTGLLEAIDGLHSQQMR